MSKKRLIWLDLLKLIAIIFVVIGHTFEYGNQFHHIAYMVNIPLFFLVAGFTLKDEPFNFKKNAARLIFPYISVCGVSFFLLCAPLGFSFAAISNFILSVIFASGGDVVGFSIHGIGMAWFLVALFFCKLFTQCILVFLRRLKAYQFPTAFVISCLLAFVSWKISESVFLPFSFLQSLASMPILLIGYLLRQINLEGFVARNYSYATISILVFMLCCFLGQDNFFSIGNMFREGSLLVNYLIVIFSSISICVICIVVVSLHSEIKALNYAADLGANSMSLYFIHAIDCMLINWGSLSVGMVSMFESFGFMLCHFLFLAALIVLLKFCRIVQSY